VAVAEKDVEQGSAASGHGAAGLHNVYTQRGVAEYFRKNGAFPDGAVLVKELLKAVTAPMTTGFTFRAIRYLLTDRRAALVDHDLMIIFSVGQA